MPRQVLEKYYYAEEEHAEYSSIEDTVGYEKYIDGRLMEQHGYISDVWVEKTGILNDDESFVDTTDGLPKVKKAPPKLVVEEKVQEVPAAEQPKPKRKRNTVGDKISQFEQQDGLGQERF